MTKRLPAWTSSKSSPCCPRRRPVISLRATRRVPLPSSRTTTASEWSSKRVTYKLQNSSAPQPPKSASMNTPGRNAPSKAMYANDASPPAMLHPASPP